MNEMELLKCPFCGSDHIVREQMNFKDSTPENMTHEDGTRKWTYIKCVRCGCSTEAYCYEHQSTKKWNTRKPVEKVLERLEEAASFNQMNKMEKRVVTKQTTGFCLGINAAYEIVKEGLMND